jgi:agmatine/peptidylarginine deiminase
MTDKVLSENPYLSREKIIQYLENWFDAEIIWLPYDKEEYLGHSDGILRYISENKVVMSPYGDPDNDKKTESLKNSTGKFWKIEECKFWLWTFLIAMNLKKNDGHIQIGFR